MSNSKTICFVCARPKGQAVDICSTCNFQFDEWPQAEYFISDGYLGVQLFKEMSFVAYHKFALPPIKKYEYLLLYIKHHYPEVFDEKLLDAQKHLVKYKRLQLEETLLESCHFCGEVVYRFLLYTIPALLFVGLSIFISEQISWNEPPVYLFIPTMIVFVLVGSIYWVLWMTGIYVVIPMIMLPGCVIMGINLWRKHTSKSMRFVSFASTDFTRVRYAHLE